MNNSEQSHMNFNLTKWMLASFLVLGALLANLFYQGPNAATVGLVSWPLAILLAGVVGLQTSQGKVFIKFVKDAWMEMERVIWPTRPETVQTTVMVSIVVGIATLLLWGIDSLLIFIVSHFTGM